MSRTIRAAWCLTRLFDPLAPKELFGFGIRDRILMTAMVHCSNRLAAPARKCCASDSRNCKGLHCPQSRPLGLPQRTAGLSRLCGKTLCCWRRKYCRIHRASAFSIRLFAFAAVQEGSWRVCGGFGRLQRVRIRLLHRSGRVIGVCPTREYV